MLGKNIIDLGNSVQQFNDDWANYWRPKLPNNDYWKNWFDGLSQINASNPLGALWIEAGMGLGAGFSAGLIGYGAVTGIGAIGAGITTGIETIGTGSISISGRLVPILVGVY